MQQDLSYAVQQIIGNRPHQEDALKVVEEVKLAPGQAGTLLLICDGMGGHTSGELAAQLVTATMARTFAQGKGSIPQRLNYAADLANSAIASRIAGDPRLSGMGTTLVAVFIFERMMYWYSVGDSPLWLVRNAQLRRLNEDHSMAAVFEKYPAGGEGSAGRSSPPGRHVLMSAMNGRKPDLIDCPSIPFTLQEEDQLLLATDGLETLRLSRLNEIINQAAGFPIRKSVEAIFNEIKLLANPQQDNASAILVRIGSQAGADDHSQLVPDSSPLARLRAIIWKFRYGGTLLQAAGTALLITMFMIFILAAIRLLS